jgi:hypothetical protein
MYRQSSIHQVPSLKTIVSTLLILGLLSTTQWAWAQSGVLLRQANLRGEPRFQADTITTVNPGTPFNVGERRGSWRKISLTESGQSGWVLDYKVRKTRPQQRAATNSTAPANKSDDDGLFSSKGISRGATGLLGYQRTEKSKSSPTTIGIRGLSAVELENAQPDPAQVKRMDRYVSPQADVQRYASQGGLKARQVAYVDEQSSERQRNQDSSEDNTGGRD